jgi:cyclohexanone monooxygenase
MAKTLSVGIIGAGPGGLALGIFLRKAGFRDFTIFDREDGVGGTWRINTYPGLACDVKSHLYSYSFDLERELVPAVVGAAGDPGVLRDLRAAL